MSFLFNVVKAAVVAKNLIANEIIQHGHECRVEESKRLLGVMASNRAKTTYGRKPVLTVKTYSINTTPFKG